MSTDYDFMMPLEKLCISLEIAQHLHQLGVNKNSYFTWQKESDGEWRLDLAGYRDGLELPAYMAAELGLLLPKYVKQGNFEYYYTQLPSKHLDKWIIFYRASFHTWYGEDQEDEKEADARGKMLIWLIENEIVKP